MSGLAGAESKPDVDPVTDRGRHSLGVDDIVELVLSLDVGIAALSPLSLLTHSWYLTPIGMTISGFPDVSGIDTGSDVGLVAEATPAEAASAGSGEIRVLSIHLKV